MLKLKVLKQDKHLDRELLSGSLPVSLYSTACLLEKNGNFLTALASRRSGLPGSVNICYENFGKELFENFVFQADSPRTWDSRIRELPLSCKCDIPEIIERCTSEADNRFSEELTRKASENNFADILGLGPGLTPAGDDFLGGALSAAAAFSRELFQMISSAVSPHTEKTSPISRYYLEFALRKRAGEDILALINSTSSGDSPGIRNIIQKLKNYGDSSGLYMLKGFAWALLRIS